MGREDRSGEWGVTNPGAGRSIVSAPARRAEGSGGRPQMREGALPSGRSSRYIQPVPYENHHPFPTSLMFQKVQQPWCHVKVQL